MQKTATINRLIETGKDFATYKNDMQKGKNRFILALEGANELIQELSPIVFDRINQPLKFLIIVSPLCSDSAVAVPAFQKLYERTTNWTYSIVYKTEIAEDFATYFKIGAKDIVPQIIICNTSGEIIYKWFDKSVSAKRHLTRIKNLELSPEEHKATILDTPELHTRFEVKQMLLELLTTIEKATYYL